MSNANWIALPKPAEVAESRLIDAILEGHFKVGEYLPPERELATQLGITRPTLREALQRLARDGWLDIHQGKPTRVCDFWHEGNLAVLSAIAQHSDHLPPDFIPNLLYVRLLLSPAYIRMAVEREANQVIEILNGYAQITNTPEAFATFDWQLHHHLTVLSGNPIFTLILNGFRNLYPAMARLYFRPQNARDRSRTFYKDLLTAAQEGNAEAAETVTRSVMIDSLALWENKE
jgi:GntR family negative regulator for fad regulon and positive regulator of fabA